MKATKATRESSLPEKDVFTTGQVARVCRCASRTVTKWFDAGLLRGYRLPLSEDRRVPRVELLRFLREHQIPFEEQSAVDLLFHRLLCLSGDGAFVDAVTGELPADDWKVRTAGSHFTLG